MIAVSFIFITWAKALGDWWDVTWPSPLGDGGLYMNKRFMKGGEAYESAKMVREIALLPNFFSSLITTPSYKLRWFKRMSEAIISRRGWTSEGKPELMTEIITDSRNWTVPKTIVGSTIDVLIFGGGGGGRRQARTVAAAL